MSFDDVSDDSLNDLLVRATAARAERKRISLSVAAENILASADKDFAIPVDRLPTVAALARHAASRHSASKLVYSCGHAHSNRKEAVDCLANQVRTEPWA